MVYLRQEDRCRGGIDKMKKLIFGMGMILSGIIGFVLMGVFTLIFLVPILVLLPIGFITGAIDRKKVELNENE